MKKNIISFISILICISFILISCNDMNRGNSSQTLVIGTSNFNGVFNPFYARTIYDRNITNITNYSLISNDPSGKPVDGIAKYKVPVEIRNNKGQVEKTIYTFELIDGVKFSDGAEVTADDIIFTYKVYLDPTYDGPSILRTIPIVGLNEYYYDDINYKAKIQKISETANYISDDEVKEYISSFVKKVYEQKGKDNIIKESGYISDKNLKGDELKSDIINFYQQKLSSESFSLYKDKAIKEKYKSLEKEYINSNISSGNITVSDISGIKKIDNKTVEVTIDGVDPIAIWTLGGVQVSPKSYYGIGSNKGNSKGKTFKKGDLSVILEKNDSPLGAGPYKFVKYSNNVVSLEANEYFFLGAPKFKKLKMQVVDHANKLNSIKSGDIDVSNPTANPEILDQAKSYGLEEELIDNLGYGYIGINSERVPDLNVRKGLMHLMNRGPAVESYYGGLANIIERSMSIVSWAYPNNVSTYYSFDPQKALEYFQKAGYIQTEENGKKILKKEDRQLKLEIGIAGDGNMDHPCGPILTQTKIEIEKLGGQLDIQDVSTNILFERLKAGQWDMWVAGWQSNIDPDMYQVYHSEGPSNHYKLKNSELDKLILEARQINDINARKVKYAKALDIVMDNAVEMPVYQRKNMYVYNPKVISKDSIPNNLSPYYSPFGNAFNGIQNLEDVK